VGFTLSLASEIAQVVFPVIAGCRGTKIQDGQHSKELVCHRERDGGNASFNFFSNPIRV
jgi:hypothetical protein